MEAWAARYETSPDAKAKELITYLKAVCLPDGEHWTNERVVVFTEYRDTQIWLKELLAQEGMGGEQVQLLFGGMEPEAARAAAAGVPGAAGRATRCGSCWPPTPPARASTCTSTATGWSTTTSRSTRTSWSSGSAASTGTASRTPRGPALRRHGLGTSQRHLRGGPGVPGPGRGQGRADGGGPRHGQRGPRRGGAAADARRDRRLRHRARGRRPSRRAAKRRPARRRQPTCPSR